MGGVILSILSGAWSGFASGFGKFVDVVKSSPPLQYLLAFIIGLVTVRHVVEVTKKDVTKTVRADEQSKIKTEIRKATDDARKAVKEAGDAVGRDLQSHRLRELTDPDPNRGARPRRD